MLAVGAGAWLLWSVQDVLLLLLMAPLLATAIGPAVDWLRRGRLTHGMGVLVVYFSMMVAIGLLLYFLVPSVVAQATAFSQTLPERLQALQSAADGLQPPPIRDAVVTALARARDAVNNPQSPGRSRSWPPAPPQTMRSATL